MVEYGLSKGIFLLVASVFEFIQSFFSITYNQIAKKIKLRRGTLETEIKFTLLAMTFPPYEGEVKVLHSGFWSLITVGEVSLTQRGRMNRDELLALMKKTAAENGADVVLLNSLQSEPYHLGVGWYYWSAKAMRTEGS